MTERISINKISSKIKKEPSHSTTNRISLLSDNINNIDTRVIQFLYEIFRKTKNDIIEGPYLANYISDIDSTQIDSILKSLSKFDHHLLINYSFEMSDFNFLKTLFSLLLKNSVGRDNRINIIFNIFYITSKNEILRIYDNEYFKEEFDILNDLISNNEETNSNIYNNHSNCSINSNHSNKIKLVILTDTSWIKKLSFDVFDVKYEEKVDIYNKLKNSFKEDKEIMGLMKENIYKTIGKLILPLKKSLMKNRIIIIDFPLYDRIYYLFHVNEEIPTNTNFNSMINKNLLNRNSYEAYAYSDNYLKTQISNTSSNFNSLSLREFNNDDCKDQSLNNTTSIKTSNYYSSLIYLNTNEIGKNAFNYDNTGLLKRVLAMIKFSNQAENKSFKQIYVITQDESNSFFNMKVFYNELTKIRLKSLFNNRFFAILNKYNNNKYSYNEYIKIINSKLNNLFLKEYSFNIFRNSNLNDILFPANNFNFVQYYIARIREKKNMNLVNNNTSHIYYNNQDKYRRSRSNIVYSRSNILNSSDSRNSGDIEDSREILINSNNNNKNAISNSNPYPLDDLFGKKHEPILFLKKKRERNEDTPNDIDYEIEKLENSNNVEFINKNNSNKCLSSSKDIYSNINDFSSNEQIDTILKETNEKLNNNTNNANNVNNTNNTEYKADNEIYFINSANPQIFYNITNNFVMKSKNEVILSNSKIKIDINKKGIIDNYSQNANHNKKDSEITSNDNACNNVEKNKEIYQERKVDSYNNNNIDLKLEIDAKEKKRCYFPNASNFYSEKTDNSSIKTNLINKVANIIPDTTPSNITNITNLTNDIEDAKKLKLIESTNKYKEKCIESIDTSNNKEKANNLNESIVSKQVTKPKLKIILKGLDTDSDDSPDLKIRKKKNRNQNKRVGDNNKINTNLDLRANKLTKESINNTNTHITNGINTNTNINVDNINSFYQSNNLSKNSNKTNHLATSLSDIVVTHEIVKNKEASEYKEDIKENDALNKSLSNNKNKTYYNINSINEEISESFNKKTLSNTSNSEIAEINHTLSDLSNSKIINETEADINNKNKENSSQLNNNNYNDSIISAKFINPLHALYKKEQNSLSQYLIRFLTKKRKTQNDYLQITKIFDEYGLNLYIRRFISNYILNKGLCINSNHSFTIKVLLINILANNYNEATGEVKSDELYKELIKRVLIPTIINKKKYTKETESLLNMELNTCSKEAGNYMINTMSRSIDNDKDIHSSAKVTINYSILEHYLKVLLCVLNSTTSTSSIVLFKTEYFIIDTNIIAIKQNIRLMFYIKKILKNNNTEDFTKLALIVFNKNNKFLILNCLKKLCVDEIYLLMKYLKSILMIIVEYGINKFVRKDEDRVDVVYHSLFVDLFQDFIFLMNKKENKDENNVDERYMGIHLNSNSNKYNSEIIRDFTRNLSSKNETKGSKSLFVNFDFIYRNNRNKLSLFVNFHMIMLGYFNFNDNTLELFDSDIVAKYMSDNYIFNLINHLLKLDYNGN